MKTISIRGGFATTVLAAGLAASAALAQAPTTPRVEAAWARPTVPGQTAGGAFLTLTGSGSPDRLVQAKSDAAQSVELHTMTMDGSVMRMRRVDGIDVGAGQKVELKPGGMHIMFIGLKEPLQTGSTVPLVLKFKEGGDVKVEVKVMASAPGVVPSAAAAPAAHKH